MDCPIPQTELDEIYAFATDLARKAGQLLLERVNDRNSEQVYAEKENAVDLVTQTDEDVESLIKTAIQTKYPAHKFLGEESYAKGQSREYLIDEQPTWCVDPLDGTVNFTHAFPMFCVSIGFIVNHYPVIGVIYAPMLNQLFSSCLNRGAWLNEMQQLPLIRKPSIPPLPATAPSKCIFACEWGKDRRDIPDGTLQRKIESFVNMAAERGSRGGKGGMVHGVRSLGSATMDLAYTAMGSVDIWWEGGCWEWDVAAGIAILLEAGGLVTAANPPEDIEGPIEPVKLGSRLYLAIRPAGPSETETGRETQERTVREVWRRVRQLDYERPTRQS
ncbi:inositol monophosphatase family protein qutG [Aspergillus nidulans FGSC A4]|uniref:Protein qutG n=1 Tax=Emericella nidulans (strain FGSC A4 / ATCC 38163 / CBS 112.46 / NRRL 194 / M139) TaxID=227321 RepID=QUTG_EMENI|nr:inositol monophosphatase family protein qutG [Aspergillus nidulans FGSC A4]P25416.2 RecName: Full=Protein qutG [Aspergillus nidulans FGSC A4]CBF88072.1 TPA: Protein qutG [Source:UniProtKB/Swiss-Prot;Acc:P25416] [Aspergillus nidulans FGSC A4]